MAQPVADGPVRVLVVDDHELFRRGLAEALAAHADIELVGEAGDGDEAVEQAVRLRPDVVLMDVRMPGTGGIEATRDICEALPDARVLMLSVSEDEGDLFEAIRAGAAGYLLKEVSIDELAEAVRSVARGHGPVSPAMAAKLFAEFRTLSRRAAAGLDRRRLTEREAEVLRLVAQGMSNKEIAGVLVIAENTVKNHVSNILEKLQMRSRMDAAMYAVRERLIGADLP